MKNIHFLTYAAAAIIVTIFSGLIYVSVQQAHRSGANDPQIEIARDLKTDLENNPVERIWEGEKINLAKSLAVFKVLFDKNGQPVQSTGLLDDKLPTLPKGVFDYTREKGEEMLTWQPRRGVRMAMVVESVQSPNGGFVAAGRSLEEVEKRESNLTTMVLSGWLSCLGVIFFHWLIFTIRNRKKN